MNERYDRNFPALNLSDLDALLSKKICIVGAGGLGGYILEEFLRIGIGHITIIDDDIFNSTNLNRQLLCTSQNLNQCKCKSAQLRAEMINKQIKISTINAKLNSKNAAEILVGHDIVMDAVDNSDSRKIMGKSCAELGIPIMHGAVHAWYLQASLIMPTSNLMELLSSDIEAEDSSCLAFTPAICASIQVAEAVKYLCGMDCTLKNKLLCMDIKTMDMEVIELKSC